MMGQTIRLLGWQEKPVSVILLLVLLGMSFVLTGCGKKATQVDPPPGVEDDTFPKIYPDIATDPKPQPQ